jgi:hypothetical protein
MIIKSIHEHYVKQQQKYILTKTCYEIKLVHSSWVPIPPISISYVEITHINLLLLTGV